MFDGWYIGFQVLSKSNYAYHCYQSFAKILVLKLLQKSHRLAKTKKTWLQSLKQQYYWPISQEENESLLQYKQWMIQQHK